MNRILEIIDNFKCLLKFVCHKSLILQQGVLQSWIIGILRHHTNKKNFMKSHMSHTLN